MGNSLTEPNTTKTTDYIKFSDLTFIHTCMQGWRNSMEDSYIMSPLSIPEHYILGIFDGHGGDEISNYIAENFLRIFESMEFWQIYKRNLLNISNDYIVDIDNEMKKLLEELCLEIDKQIFKNCKNVYRCGSTGTIVLISPDRYYCVNVGDSRTILCNNGNAIPLSFDHKPNNKEEKKRIVDAKAYILNNRVNGELALSRAFGDFIYKNGFEDMKNTAVTAFPDVTITERNSKDEYLILACDGLWDVMSTENLVDRIKQINENFEQIRKEETYENMKKEIVKKYKEMVKEIQNNTIYETKEKYYSLEKELNMLEESEINKLVVPTLQPINNEKDRLKFIVEKIIDEALNSKDNVSMIMVKL